MMTWQGLLKKACGKLRTDYIDIFNLHAAKATLEVFEQRSGALRFLLEMKEQKILCSVGISTHNVKIVKLAGERDDIDVIFPLINISGYGILEGSRQDMLNAINSAYKEGKGIFAMKVFAGGNLLVQYDNALHWVRSIEGISSFAIGVINVEELKMNLKNFGVDSIGNDALFSPVSVKKMSILKLLCIGCGKCIEACPNGALRLENKKAVVSSSDCVMCGYCTPHCTQLAIRLL
jgi:predicted aldo/keto reductase-like oxidoreductase